MNSIEITELLNLLYSNKPVNIVDIRTNYEYQLNRIPTAKNISRDLLELAPEKYLNKNSTYYIYCQSGSSSQKLVQKLNSKGYHTVNITGGFNNYLLRK